MHVQFAHALCLDGPFIILLLLVNFRSNSIDRKDQGLQSPSTYRIRSSRTTPFGSVEVDESSQHLLNKKEEETDDLWTVATCS